MLCALVCAVCESEVFLENKKKKSNKDVPCEMQAQSNSLCNEWERDRLDTGLSLGCYGIHV